MSVRAGCLGLGSILLSVSVAAAGQVRPVNLEEMTARAEVIFAGRCVEVRTDPDLALGRELRVATFEVHRAVKGEVGRRVSVRMPELSDGAGVAELPAFVKGEEVVLFLYGESALGFRAPVGLGQGRFKVALDKRGRPMAVNDVANRNLLLGLSPAARERLARLPGAGAGAEGLDPSALLDMAEALVASAP